MIVVFSGHVRSVQRRFDGGETAQMTVVAEGTLGARCSVVCRVPAFAPPPVYGEPVEVAHNLGKVMIAIHQCYRHDWEVESADVDESFDARRVTELPSCPSDLRVAAEKIAKAWGVELDFAPGHLLVRTARGTIRKDLDIPGMIEPGLGWKKLLMELGLDS